MIKLRGHMLLCLQGFQGKGYSGEFIANMDKIHKTLQENPQTQILLLDGPDEICGSCPHLKNNGCTLHGQGTETQMTHQDRDVLQRLALNPGDRIAWQDLLHKISKHIKADDLDLICGKCPWLPLGLCKAGMNAL